MPAPEGDFINAAVGCGKQNLDLPEHTFAPVVRRASPRCTASSMVALYPKDPARRLTKVPPSLRPPAVGGESLPKKERRPLFAGAPLRGVQKRVQRLEIMLLANFH